MKEKGYIEEELKGISPLLAGITKENVYSVPEGYFNTLAETLCIISKNENEVFGKKILYNVPDGYFDNFAAGVMAKIKAEENDYPVLAQISKKNVYTVPEGYFDTLSDAVLAKTGEATHVAKVVSIKSTMNWLKYAVAAVFVGVVSFGVIKFTGTSIPGAETAGVDKSFTTERVNKLKNTDVDKELEGLSDEAIINYLDETGDADAAVVASFVNEDELPDEMDYMLDDKTLDNFLNNTDFDKN